jgi:hypothetical protein
VEFVEGAAKGVTVQIVLGVAAEVKAPLEQRIARAIQQAAQRIKSLGPRIFFTEQLEGGISRTTVLGLMRLAEASGQDISVVAATLNGLDPVARQKILDRIAAQDVDGAVDIHAVESNLQRVRVGQHRAVTAAAGGTLTPAQAGQVNDVIDQAVDLGPDEIARRFREGIISQGGGEPSPNDPSGPVGPGINSVSFDGPNINVTMDDGTTLSVTPGSPSGLAGQGVAGALTAMGVPSGLANAIGSGVDLGITFGLGGIGGMLNTAAGLVVGLARGRGPLSGLPSISVTPPNAGRGLDPDEGFTPEDDAVPEGVVTVGEPTIADAPDGSGPGAPGDGTGGVGAGGTGSSGDPSAYAEGGWVRGRGRRDTVRARLTPGEFVATRGAAAEHGAELEEMNRRAAGNYPRAPEPPPMSDEQIEQVFTRARSMSLKRDLGWFPGDRNMPRPAAWAI